MKRLLSLLMILVVVLTTGCQKVANLVTPKDDGKKEEGVETTYVATNPSVTQDRTDESDENKVTKKIRRSEILQTTNNNEIVGNFNYKITKKDSEDRIMLSTSADFNRDNVDWKNPHHWCLAVVSDDNNDGKFDAAYNLFYGEMTGQMYMEVSEYFINGISTPVITAYIFNVGQVQIRNYIFNGEEFEETIVYEDVSTGSINTHYTSIPECKPM